MVAYIDDLPNQYNEAPKRYTYVLLGAGKGNLRGFSIESLPDF
jgi:hypothetical protein